MRALFPMASLLALAAPAAAQPAVYRAVGTEPFWSLTIDPDTIRFQSAGEPFVEVRTPRVINGFAGEIYRTPRLNVNIVHARCSDGMSDRSYRDRVTVQIGRRSYEGCGGALEETPPPVVKSRLTDTKWTVDTVNGRRIQADRPLTVNFTADRVEGKLCNGFGGGYTLRGERLTVGPVMATKMACQGPAMTAETTIFAMWRQPVKATVSRWGTLILERGRDTITLRPARR